MCTNNNQRISRGATYGPAGSRAPVPPLHASVASRRSLLAMLALALTAAFFAGVPTAARAAATMPTAADIDAHLVAKGSPMAGQGAAFVASGGAWKVDPRLLVAIAGAESAYGRITCAPYNAWGWGCPNNPYRFSSWAEAIDTIDKGLRENYLDEGRTSVALIGAKYAPVGAANDPTNLNSAWVINVSQLLVQLGGDPGDVSLSDSDTKLLIGPRRSSDLDSTFASDTAAQPAGGKPATVEPGAKTVLRLRIRNSGSVAWAAGDVRLRRLDSDPRIASAAYAALAGDKVRPGAVGTFTIQIEARGQRAHTGRTSWRLEGPSGPFGATVRRDVRVEVETLSATLVTVEGPRRLAPGERSAVVVTVRNDGTAEWQRDGDGGMFLGLVQAQGASLVDGRWASPTVPAALLERSVAPGETGSFAFPVRMGDDGRRAVLTLRVFGGDRWAAGEPIRVSVEAAGASA